ncbi:adenylyl-sulfate kinase [Conexibacter sp. CPCC 206217]|uniref:adenylyl-sulfate kinase n=1 Tax=Conexibacter sp. CPCC 206217 TaxID=3064574 RepID=UPI00271ACA85|nr:adenylyl-sulfate kinase [Conexibacter sp. CPCC 206217]MDO8213771.1 adenylyl-sulfate kinase [Conexibacter sp. CPCC 206217]
MMTSANVTWHEGVVGRAQRWSSLGVRGATIWFTGLPASGKSTIAAATEARLVGEGRSAYRLDGDNLRHGVCGDLGFSTADRDENVRRTAEVARLFADSGSIAIVSVVSPFESGRRAARALHERDGLHFVEVFVNTPVEECMRRDPKGLYARAVAGQLTGMTGVDAPYEVPSSPDVELLGPCDVTDAVERVLTALEPARAI